MNGLVALSLLLSISAFIGTSPFWIKLLLPHIYSANITFHLYDERIADDLESGIIRPGSSINYHNLPELSMRIRRGGDRWVKFSIVVYSRAVIGVDESVRTGPVEFEDDMPFSAVSRLDDPSDAVIGRGVRLKSKYNYALTLPIAEGDSPGVVGTSVPLRVAVVPTIPLSEFGLPKFFGEAQLKPVIHDYDVTELKPISEVSHRTKSDTNR